MQTAWQRKWLDLEVTHPDLQKLADAAHKFCFDWFQNAAVPKLLVVVGKTGCGKTHVAKRVRGWASAVAYERWLRRESGNQLPEIVYVEWSDIANPQRMAEESFCEWRRTAADASLLILDDIGTEADVYKSGIPTSRLCEVLNYRAGRFTLITTNVPASGWASRWDARVEDRLMRNSTVLELTAPSFANFS